MMMMMMMMMMMGYMIERQQLCCHILLTMNYEEQASTSIITTTCLILLLLLLLLQLLTHLTQGRHPNSTESISDEVEEGRTERSDGSMSKHAVTDGSHGVFTHTKVDVTTTRRILLE